MKSHLFSNFIHFYLFLAQKRLSYPQSYQHYQHPNFTFPRQISCIICIIFPVFMLLFPIFRVIHRVTHKMWITLWTTFSQSFKNRLFIPFFAVHNLIHFIHQAFFRKKSCLFCIFFNFTSFSVFSSFSVEEPRRFWYHIS